MPYHFIKGTFHIQGYSPDGDSIRFRPYKQDAWSLLPGKQVSPNGEGMANLRLDGIDTLECNFKKQTQNPEIVSRARTVLYDLLGIDNYTLNKTGTKVSTAADSIPGYILTRGVDTRGRPISFAFTCDVNPDDSNQMYAGKTLIKKSINYKLFAKGLAYPCFYSTLFYDLRNLFAEETVKMRKDKVGLWEFDKSNTPFTIESQEQLNQLVIFPKLFRRMTHWLQLHPHLRFEPREFCQQSSLKNERVLELNRVKFTHFNNVIKAHGRTINLSLKPEEMVFLDQ